MNIEEMIVDFDGKEEVIYPLLEINQNNRKYLFYVKELKENMKDEIFYIGEMNEQNQLLPVPEEFVSDFKQIFDKIVSKI